MAKPAIIPPGSATPGNSTGTREFASYATTDVSFRGVRFVAHRVGASVVLRYLKRVRVEDCEFVGGGISIWVPVVDVQIRNNTGRLSCGAPGQAAPETPLPCAAFVDMYGWGGSGHVSDVVVEGNVFGHLHPPNASFFPGRFVVGQVYYQRHIYVGGNHNLQAGPGAYCDQNQGEQVLFETTGSDNTLRVVRVDPSGRTVTVTSTEGVGIDSPGMQALYNRAGLIDDGSTAAAAWNYVPGLAQVHIQRGSGTGQHRVVVDVHRVAPGTCVLVLDRPFTVPPQPQTSILNIMLASTHRVIVEDNHFVGVNKSHITGPHVATTAIFLWANTMRYTALNNKADWIRYGVALFCVQNASLADVLADGLTVNNSNMVVNLIPSFEGHRSGWTGVVVRGISSTGDIASAAIGVSLPACSGATASNGNKTGTTGLVVDDIRADNAPVAVSFTITRAAAGHVCDQPPAYSQALVSRASFAASAVGAQGPAVALNGSVDVGTGVDFVNVTLVGFKTNTGGISPPQGLLRLPRPHTTAPAPGRPWALEVCNDGTVTDTAIVHMDVDGRVSDVVIVGDNQASVTPFGGRHTFYIQPTTTALGGQGDGYTGTVCSSTTLECLRFRLVS